MSCNVTYRYNNTDGVNVFIGDASSCDMGSDELTKTTLNNYIPFSRNQPTTTSFTISGDCCYINDPSECSSFDLTEIARGTWHNDTTDNSYILCGRRSPTINKLTSQAMSLDTTNITTFISLIIAIFISVLFYAIFVVGPFLFWIKYAPRMYYEKGCHTGKTILERHYCRDENELPYNWELLSGCEKPPKQVLPSLDKCPSTHSMYSDNPLGNVGGSIWDKIVYHIGGFPYYCISKDRESLYKQYNGNLFIVSILCISVIFTISFVPFMVEKNKLGAKIGCGFGLVFLLTIIPVVLSKYFFKIQTTSFFNKFHLGIVGLSIAGYIINVVIRDIPHFIMPIIITVGFFILLWHMSSYTNSLGKNLGFMEALIKGLYFIRKSYVNSIKYSLMGGRGTSQWWLKTIGEWPIPNWIYIIFGKIITPIFLTIIFICRSLVSFWDAVRGLFGHLKTIKYRQKLQDQGIQLGGGKIIDKIKNIPTTTAKGIKNIAISTGKGIKDTVKSSANYSKKFAQDSYDEAAAGPYIFFKRYETGWSGLLSLLPIPFGLCFALFMLMINNLFFFFSYHFIPLTYPSILLNIISCNIHKFGFLFGIGVIALCWKLIHEKQSPLPTEVVIGMTISFAVLVIYNLFTKK